MSWKKFEFVVEWPDKTLSEFSNSLTILYNSYHF